MTLAEAIPLSTAVALGLGRLAKGWRRFDDRMIPTLVAIAGAILVPALCDWAGWRAVVLYAVNGFSAGLGATGLNQLWRQSQTPAPIKKTKTPPATPAP